MTRYKSMFNLFSQLSIQCYFLDFVWTLQADDRMLARGQQSETSSSENQENFDETCGFRQQAWDDFGGGVNKSSNNLNLKSSDNFYDFYEEITIKMILFLHHSSCHKSNSDQYKHNENGEVKFYLIQWMFF